MLLMPFHEAIENFKVTLELISHFTGTFMINKIFETSDREFHSVKCDVSI